MGYCMEQRETNFRIKAENRQKAFEACKGLIGKETISDASGRHFSWVSTDVLIKAKNLKEFMDEWRWEIEEEINDEIFHDIIDIQFTGEKLGDDEILFNAIAPFVEPGSFIEMQGEDGSLWRWIFDGESCEEKQANISWE